MKTIIFNGRLITVTMEVPGLSSLDYKRKYTAHLESLWQSSTIHASKELMERFKDGETVVEGKDYVHSDAVFDKTTDRFICIANNAHNLKIDYSQVEFRRIALPVPLPAVEEGSQDETRDKLRRDLKEKFGFETGTVRRITAYLFNNYNITKI